MWFFYAFYMIKIDYVYGSNLEILLIFYSFHRYFANKILMDNRNLKFRENSDILRFYESQRPNPAPLMNQNCAQLCLRSLKCGGGSCTQVSDRYYR